MTEKEYRNSCLEYLKMKTKTVNKISCFLAELIGTGLLVFLGCMGCIKTETIPNSHLQAAFNFGLVVMVIIQCFSCVSGAHLNPSVTVAAYIYNIVSLPMAAVYIVGQMLGAFIGYGLLKAVVPAAVISAPGAEHGLCMTVLGNDISVLQGVSIEFVITCVLVWVCCGVWDPRNTNFLDSVAIRFGLAIASLALTAGPFTGASMNSARSFAPAIWNNDFENHWIYWIGPLAAAVIAAIAYKAVFRREVDEEKLAALEELPLSNRR